MKLRFFNKTIENRRFEYSPRYYDERKESLRAKKELYDRLRSGDLSAEERRKLLREEMRKQWSRANYRKSQQRSSNVRILILIAVLIALGYFVFFGIDQVQSIVHKLW